jgi:hypothetical protein
VAQWEYLSGTIWPVISAASPAEPQPSPRLVYGHAESYDCLAFADATTAAEEAAEIVAIATARTWGEARAVPARHTWNPAGPESAGDPSDHPDDESFDIRALRPVIDGDWPSMVTSRALTLLPQDLQARFGTNTATALNGDFLELPVTAEAELVAALQERGFEVTRDDDLINALDGRTFNP